MAKTKSTPHCSQPEPNPFLKKTSTMSTHIVTTSNPASPDEPQPSMPHEEIVPEQPQMIHPEPTAQVVFIQPQPSSQDIEAPPSKDVTPEKKREEPKASQKGRRKKKKKMKKDKKPKKPKKMP